MGRWICEHWYTPQLPPTMTTCHLDHLVLTVQDIEQTCEFYRMVLGIPTVHFGDGRRALHLGNQKINLHEAQHPLPPHAQTPLPGTADFCLITTTPLTQLITHLRSQAIPILLGPVERTGAQGPLQSIYLRDPDGNLLEIANGRSPQSGRLP